MKTLLFFFSLTILAFPSTALAQRTSRSALLRSCNQGNAKDCNELAISWAEGDGGPINNKNAIKYHGIACEKNYFVACFNLAKYHDYGVEVPENPEKAKDLYEKACEGKHFESCRELADKARQGSASGDGLKEAADIFKRACGRGDGDSCFELGNLAQRGEGRLGGRDVVLSAYEKGCQLKHAQSCFTAGKIYLSGTPSSDDKLRGEALSDDACIYGGASFCVGKNQDALIQQKAARDAANSRVTPYTDAPILPPKTEAPKSPPEESRAQEAIRPAPSPEAPKNAMPPSPAESAASQKVASQDQLARGAWPQCGPSGADSPGCFERQFIMNLPPMSKESLEESRDFFFRNCERKDAFGCYAIAWLDSFESQETAREGFQKACRYGNSEACSNLGILWAESDPADVIQAGAAFSQACLKKNASACTNLGILGILSNKGEASNAAALSYFDQACELDDSIGCYNAGIARAIGYGVPPSKSEAQNFLDKACKLQFRKACLVK